VEKYPAEDVKLSTANMIKAADRTTAIVGYRGTASFWRGLQADLRDFEAGKAPFSQPLWLEENSLTDMWRETKNAFVAHNETEKWAFWIWWYDGLLAGTAPSPDHQMFQDIALIPDDEWQDEDAVLSKINRIWRSYDLERADQPSRPEPLKSGREEIKEILARKEVVASQKQILKTKKSIQANQRSLPPTIEGLKSLILLELEHWQQNNWLNAEQPELCRRQVEIYLAMYNAVDQMQDLIPPEGEPVSDEVSTEIVGLGALYLEKFKSLPREKVDDVVQGAWARAGLGLDLGLVFGTAALGTAFGLAPLQAVVAGSMVFGGKNAGNIIKWAKELNAPTDVVPNDPDIKS
jgi:hypothetical protein